MTAADYIQIIFIVLFAIALVFNMLRCKKLGFTKALIKLILLVVAAAISLLVTQLIMGFSGGYVESLVVGYIPTEYKDILNASDSLKGYACSLLVGLVGPIVFVIVFLIVSLLIKIIGLVLNSAFEKVQLKNEKANKGLGILVGVVCALVATSCYLMPVAGYLTVGSDLNASLNASGLVIQDESGQASTVINDVCAAKDKPAVSVVASMTKFMFEGSSSVVVDNTKVGAASEINVLIEMIPQFANLTKMKFDDIGNIDMTPIDSLIASLDGSKMLTRIVSEVVSKAATAWYNSEAFLGINIKEQLPKDYKSSLDGVLTMLKSTDENKIIGDLTAFSSAAKTLSKTYAYSQTLSTMKDKINSGDMTKEEIKQELQENMTEIINTLTPESVDLITGAITPEVISGSTGVSVEGAEVVVDVITNSLSSIAGMSEEEKAAEAQALNTIVSYISEGNTVTPEDADEVINAMLESKAVMTSIETAVTDENMASLGIGEEQQTTITKAIDDYVVANPTLTADQKADLDALRTLFAPKA